VNRIWAVLAAVVLILVAAYAAAPDIIRASTTTTTATSTSTQIVISTVSGAPITRTSILNATVTSTVTVAPPGYAIVNSSVSNGLEVSALIGPVQAASGQNITITEWVSNTLSSVVTVNATQIMNPVSGLCPDGFAGAEVYPGNYTASDLPSGMGFDFINPPAVSVCTTTTESQISISPNSLVRSSTSDSSGYYAGFGRNYTFTYFPPGTYTVKIFDAWNQVAIGYFEITA
jgi:hypothetical protein